MESGASQLCSSGRSVRAGGRLLVFVMFALRRFLRRLFGRLELFVLGREVGIFLGQTIHLATEMNETRKARAFPDCR